MDIGKLLKDTGFAFSKSLGQNFITDTNLLSAITVDAGVESGDTVVEVGAGAGTLTKSLADKAGRVISFEVDETLKPILQTTLLGVDNAEVVFADPMSLAKTDGVRLPAKEQKRLSFERIAAMAGGGFKVVANLPYYITTELIFFFLENSPMPESITVMVQKEVAERICAKPGTSDYGALSAAVQARTRPYITRIVSKNMFRPVPKVDSAVVRMDALPEKPGADYEFLSRVISAAFAMRRKTLLNNLMSGFSLDRERAEIVLDKCGIDRMARGETLSPDRFFVLAGVLKDSL